MQSLVDYIETLPLHGSKTAVIYQTMFRTFRWSYRELYRDVRRTAGFLGKVGIGPGDHVVLWAPNSPQWVMLFLGALYRGAVPVPADVGSTPEFVRLITDETAAKAVFRSRSREDPGVSCPVRIVEDLPYDIQDVEPQAAPHRVDENDEAQVLYTSGTTGKPKGVVLTHRNVVANLRSREEAMPIGPDHVVVSVLPLSHIFEQSVSFWAALTSGATVVYLQVVKPSELLRALKRFPVTVLAVVPQVLDLLAARVRRRLERLLPGGALDALVDRADRMPMRLRRLLFAPVHVQMGRSFRFFVVGGAPLDPDTERFWEAMGFPVLQGYGLTEAAPVVTLNRMETRRRGSVGQPLPRVEVRVDDDGEVLVRGANVMRGYFQDPERTAEVLDDGWLRTGDLGYMDGDGYLYIKGRKKDLIVTPAGLNVYPEDVEAALLKAPGVRDAAVIEYEGRVHAALLMEPGMNAGKAVDHANDGLAEHQRVRSHTVWPEEFPRTTTRKVKKHELREAIDRMGVGRQEEGSAHRHSGRESEIIRVIAQVSGRNAGVIQSDSRLGQDLGLDSVDRIALVGMLEEQLNTEVPEDSLVDETTVREVEELAGQGIGRRRFARWALAPPTRLAREGFQRWLIFPAYRIFARQSVKHQRWAEVREPVVFAPNHTSHLDTIAVLYALPHHIRRNVAVAQFAEFFEAPLRKPHVWLLKKALFPVLTLGLNIYPLPRTSGFRQSLQYTGELLDRGWHILVFPEGRMTTSGNTEEFREGIGVLAKEMQVPVVPVFIEGLYGILPWYRKFPRRGSAEVRFGRPLRAGREGYMEFTKRLEEEVLHLGEAAGSAMVAARRRLQRRPAA